MLGKAALPRKRKRLAFDASWEIQAFALAVALSQGGIYGAEEFHSQLIGELNGDTNNVHGYYQCWLASFETLLIQKGFLSSEEIDRKVAEFSMY